MSEKAAADFAQLARKMTENRRFSPEVVESFATAPQDIVDNPAAFCAQAVDKLQNGL